MNCPIDQNPLQGKQKYCSVACRKKASRVPDIADITIPAIEAFLPTGPEKYILSSSDLIWEESKAGYYNFSEKERLITCFVCATKVKTRLSAAKTCSPRCLNTLIQRLAGVRAQTEEAK